jgi:rhodanese-related sulfurtransferase
MMRFRPSLDPVAVQQISPQELQKLSNTTKPTVLDVREEWEYAQAHLPGSVHIPMGQIPARFNELDAAQPVVVICHHGMRSLQVGQFLEKKGFTQVSNLAGGLDAWAEQIDPSMPRY